MKKLAILFSILLSSLSAHAADRTCALVSPDGSISMNVTVGPALSYSVAVDGKTVVSPTEIALRLADGSVYGGGAKLRKMTGRSVDSSVKALFYKRSEVLDRFNEMTLTFKDFQLVLRAYDDGVAYRFVSLSKSAFKVVSEDAGCRFPADYDIWNCYVRSSGKSFKEQFHNSHENVCSFGKCSGLDSSRLSMTPLCARSSDGVILTFAEADLMNYPGMYMCNPDGGTGLKAVFAPVPKTTKSAGTALTVGIIKLVDEVWDYIASCGPGEVFPWRIVGVNRTAAQASDSDMVWRLATPSEDVDWSWVKPGKAVWEWWHAHNIRGVDFKSGFNTATYKYYIDFAAANKCEYILMDGGWSTRSACDLMQVVPEIDLPELVRYGREKGVGIILWAGYWPFCRDMEKVCRHYSEMGIKGFKVDFHDRDDQEMIAFYRSAAEMTAKYHLLLDFHGCSKPTGLQRTYPNVIGFEGVYGLENVKFMNGFQDMVTNEVTIPYLRMYAGPADYTQGAFRNASKSNFRVVDTEPMSLGTRARQIAMYVAYFEPFTMLCDNPANYMAEPACTDFLCSIPVTWDETRALSGSIGESLAVARRKGSVWYVAAMNAWNAMDMKIDLSFLPEGNYEVEMLCDGVNADRIAGDYRIVKSALPSDRVLDVHLSPAGGCCARISLR